jgi:hypothetical protein
MMRSTASEQKGKITTTLLGSEGTFECLEVPCPSEALLGVFPLEMLGIALDLNNQRSDILPIDQTETPLTKNFGRSVAEG